MALTSISRTVNPNVSSKLSNKSKYRQQPFIRSTWFVMCFYAASFCCSSEAFGAVEGLVSKHRVNPIIDSWRDSESFVSRLNSSHDNSQHRSQTQTAMYYSRPNGHDYKHIVLQVSSYEGTSMSRHYRNKLYPSRCQQHTQLKYRKNDNDYAETESTTNLNNGHELSSNLWRPNRKFTTNNVGMEKEQFILDDYLQFLDKRYHRLHADEMETKCPRVYTALKRLFNSTESFDKSESDQHNQFYEIGVAGLASRRVLKSLLSIDHPAVTIPLSKENLTRVMRLVVRVETLAMANVSIIRLACKYRNRTFTAVKRVIFDVAAKCTRNVIINLDHKMRKGAKMIIFSTVVLVGISTVLIMAPLQAVATRKP